MAVVDELEYLCTTNAGNNFRLRLGAANKNDTNDTTLLTDTSSNSLDSADVTTGIAITTDGLFTLKAEPQSSSSIVPSYRENTAGKVYREIKGGYTYENQQGGLTSFAMTTSQGAQTIKAKNDITFNMNRKDSGGDRTINALEFETKNGDSFVYCVTREKIRQRQETKVHARRMKFTGAINLKFVFDLPIGQATGFCFSYNSISTGLYLGGTATGSAGSLFIKMLTHQKLIQFMAMGISGIAYKQVYSDYELQVIKNEHQATTRQFVDAKRVRIAAYRAQRDLLGTENAAAEVDIKAIYASM